MTSPLIRRFAGTVALGVCLASTAAAAPTIGVLLKGRSDFWTAVEKGAVEAAQKEGLEITVKMPLAEADIGIQVQLLNSMVAQGLQAIVIAPDSKDALAAPVAAAIAKGVKVVVLDSPIAGPMPVFVATNHEDAGAAAGKLLTTFVSEEDEVCILKHSQTGVATTLRERSAYNAIHDVYPKMVVHRDIYSGAETGFEVEKAKLVFSQHPDTKAVLCSGTPGTMAMLKVIESQQLGGKVKLVGFGFNLSPTIVAALQNDVMHGWIAQVPKEIGAKGVTMAAALLKGQTVPEQVYCDFVVVTKANLGEPQVQALLQE
ncbi:putative D-ribose-binding periplasmic protein [Opitutus terrae PB90-1]|uniref:Putative D-ribose-binding periplasmic protein n=2 Tax=Opitutus terrae TaxID=107709 RepID=B1ZWL5_OPITP|nr:putative D-ribose-binding periplasmic protein [Opitutus terrae PB90-1]